MMDDGGGSGLLADEPAVSVFGACCFNFEFGSIGRGFVSCGLCATIRAAS